MDSGSLCTRPATELVELVESGEYSPVELIDAHLARIDEREPDLNAFVTVLEDEARAAAREAERAIAAGEDFGPLWGIPVAIKDLLARKEGVRNTLGSRAFADNVADRNSVLVDRIEDAGGIVIGTTNTPEFARKGTTDNEVAGSTGNPFNPEMTAGGSSGGSAAAVASGMAAIAEGSDVAGSIRQPASICGVYGVMPSPGVVPTDFRPNGFVADTPYFNEGVLARTVDDAALLLSVLAGPHPVDPTCAPLADTDYTAPTPAAEPAVAYTPDMGIFSLGDSVAAAFNDAVGTLSSLGGRVDPYPLDVGHDFEDLLDAYLTMLVVNSAEFDECFRDAYDVDVVGEERDLVTEQVAKRTKRAREIAAVEYTHAGVARTDVYDAVRAVFEDYDVLVTPTLAIPPFERESGGPTGADFLPIEDSFGWMLTWPLNMSGHPAVSIPMGHTADGFPMGLQIIGDRFAEDTVLAVSATFERASPWIDSYPD